MELICDINNPSPRIKGFREVEGEALDLDLDKEVEEMGGEGMV